MSESGFLYHQSGSTIAYWEYALIRGNALVSDIVSESFRYSLGDKDDLLLVATFRIPYDHFDTINVGWRQIEHFTNPHPSSGLKLQNEPISYIQGGIDDFIYGLPVDHCPGSYSRWSKNSPNDGTVAGVGDIELIAIVDVVEKSAKVSTPGVLGALFSGIGQGSKKAECILWVDTANSSAAKFSCETT